MAVTWLAFVAPREHRRPAVVAAIEWGLKTCYPSLDAARRETQIPLEFRMSAGGAGRDISFFTTPTFLCRQADDRIRSAFER